MAIWKQLLGIIVLLGLVGFGVVAYVPGGRAYLETAGLLAAKSDAAAPQADATKNPAGAGGPGRGGGARMALVVLQPATEAVINDRLSTLGTGSAVQSAVLMPSTSGTLTEVRVTSGAQVTAGQVIAMLDPASAQVAYDAAKIVLDDARRTLERNQRLGSGSVVSATQLQALDVTTQQAELALRKTEIELKNREIVSPINGTLGLVQVDPGGEVTASSVIASVQDMSKIKVSFSLPERFVGRVAVNDPVSAIPVSLPALDVTATITAIDNRVDPATGSFEVEAIIVNDKALLRPGMTFTMAMQFPGDTFVAVPPLAIQWGSDGAYIWQVVDGKAHRIDVRIVQRNAENVLVAGGVAVGDQIVTEGLETLKDGAQVRVFGTPQTDEAGAGKPAGKTP
ncbi:efflux RND transporter periplasmic adaptor subunit [Pseudorhodobacter sp.]|uniref:efflux RND transporter periplasmic adaptor subunit n=1 Tax=Pseudorhodobacter sp. TaxID=1934400 RepID=UPI002648AF1D|nr:efflux RND transporter periplasmic adaptor subunit [Pseudorhodobacter sp.]MDN5788210.1 efflux RND transporter periplasmic adaptor subunit [Pseudorhodobacter sp.]